MTVAAAPQVALDRRIRNPAPVLRPVGGDDCVRPMTVYLGLDPGTLLVVGLWASEQALEQASEHCAYQFVAVEVSIAPTDASQRSASMAALQPSPAAVTAWR